MMDTSLLAGCVEGFLKECWTFPTEGLHTETFNKSTARIQRFFLIILECYTFAKDVSTMSAEASLERTLCPVELCCVV